MPMPGAVEPTPVPPRLSRLTEPDEAQEASYFAASARMASFSCRLRRDTSSHYVLAGRLSRAMSCGRAMRSSRLRALARLAAHRAVRRKFDRASTALLRCFHLGVEFL